MIARTIRSRAALLAVLLGGLGLLAPHAHAGFWRSLGRQVYATMRGELGATFAGIPDRDGDLWRDMYFTFEEEHERFFDEFRDAHDEDDFASLESGEAAFYSGYYQRYSFWAVPLARAGVDEEAMAPGEEEGFEQPDVPEGSTGSDAGTGSGAKVAGADGSGDTCGDLTLGEVFGLGGVAGACTRESTPVVDAPSAQDFTTLLAGAPEFTGVEFEILVPASGVPMLAPVAAERAFSSPTWRLVRLSSGIQVSVPGYAYPSRVTVDPPAYEGEERQWSALHAFGWSGIAPRGEPDADPEDEWVLRWAADEPVAIRLPRSVVEYAEAMLAGPPAPEDEERPVTDAAALAVLPDATVAAEDPLDAEAASDEVTLGGTYIVQEGDTLGDIAVRTRRLLGEEAPPVWGPTGIVATLAAVNGDSVADPDTIYAGSLLYVPPAEVFADEVRLALLGGPAGAAD